MVITGLGLAGLMTLQVDTPYWQLAFWQLVVGAGSGIFNSPNTSAVMGVVPPDKRGVGAGMRMMLMQSGFVVSIALAIGLVTSSMDPKVMVAIFSGDQIGGQGISLAPFMNALHLAFLAGVVASALSCSGVNAGRWCHDCEAITTPAPPWAMTLPNSSSTIAVP